MNAWWLLVGGAYLIGSLSTALFVGWQIGRNPSKEGSKNPGATNVYRIAGYKAGAIVLLGDVLKGVGPTLLALLLASRTIAIACGAAAVIGHIFPVFTKFKGGKGVATFGGTIITLHLFVGLIALFIWILVLALTKLSSLAALISIPLIILGFILVGSSGLEISVISGLGLLIVIRHIENIKRLRHGRESSFGSS